jgi:hypothetical protein
MASCSHPARYHITSPSTGITICGLCGSLVTRIGVQPPAGYVPSPISFVPEPPTTNFIKINCPHCWKEVSLSEVYIFSIALEQKVDLECCKKVPVGGENGILARVARAKKAEQ